MKLIILLLTIFTSIAAQATGCLGGDWQTIEQQKLPPIEIKSSYSTKNAVEVLDNLAYLMWSTFTPIEGSHRVINFVSRQFDMNKISMSEVLTKVNEREKQFPTTVEKTVQINRYYDDCMDIPENTKQTTIVYRFQLSLSGGEQLEFRAQEETYDPPLRAR